MAWLRKKADPISDRARALNDEIAALEAQIKTLDSRLQHRHPAPRLRSTALPQSPSRPHSIAQTRGGLRPTPETIFEEVDINRLQGQPEAPVTPKHYNELGLRKYDLPALLQRVRNHFRGPAASNPKLVSYLAAGGIQGLRPLRYEKRVARNRFIVFVVILILVLLGVFAVLRRV